MTDDINLRGSANPKKVLLGNQTKSRITIRYEKNGKTIRGENLTLIDEVYLTTFDGVERVTITYPEMGDIAMQFSTLNGAFLEITSWSYIKQVGEKL